jgi:hypothetical protein
MRKSEFIQKYLGNANYQFTDENRELMYDDLCRVVDYDRALMESYRVEYEKMKGDPPKKCPLPKDFVKLKYMHVPSKNQNSDFSL